MFEPFAFYVWRRHTNGESIERLAEDLKIPADRIQMRISAVRELIQQQFEQVRCLAGRENPLGNGAFTSRQITAAQSIAPRHRPAANEARAWATRSKTAYYLDADRKR